MPVPKVRCPQVLDSFLDTCSEGTFKESYLKTILTFLSFQVITQTNFCLVIFPVPLLTLPSQYSYTLLFTSLTQLLSPSISIALAENTCIPIFLFTTIYRFLNSLSYLLRNIDLGSHSPPVWYHGI